jgi:sugar transferase (PEP-CTERM/EpsH1 system associated)
MANILYLVHRLPYPPNKGDKVRSYHLLKHLLRHHRVYLGTFIDDPEDDQHIDTLRSLCTDLHVSRLNPRRAKIRSLKALLTGEPLTLRYYRDTTLKSWVDRTCRRKHIDVAVIFSSAMAQYVEQIPRLTTVIDFVDVDSAKWTQYAPRHRWPLSWVYRREGRLLLEYERRMAARAARSFFVTEKEASLFGSQAPECAVRVEAMGNGVDADYFSSDAGRPSPYAVAEVPVVFTGAMDYWPNIDAVTWFTAEVLPKLLLDRPQARFYIVGRSPTFEVLALASERIVVTGTVTDVRPYLQYAAVVVAPLRIARGIQNKILEAMSMSRPVIASAECAAAIDAVFGQELLTAISSEDYVAAIKKMLDSPETAAAVGEAARQRVTECYSWEAHLTKIDRYLPVTKREYA